MDSQGSTDILEGFKTNRKQWISMRAPFAPSAISQNHQFRNGKTAFQDIRGPPVDPLGPFWSCPGTSWSFLGYPGYPRISELDIV